MPALEALLSAALEREALQAGVVETAALRQADVVKTALLRAVSHDLRSPLTAISAAGEAIALAGVSAGEREELASVIVGETRRLSRLVENLLDLSRLEAGAAEPRAEWMSVEEVLGVALEDLAPTGPGRWTISDRRRRRRGGQGRPTASSSRSRSTATCRWCGPTRRSWSGRS